MIARLILQYVPEGFVCWKYNHYFPIAKGEGEKNTFLNKNTDIFVDWLSSYQ